MYGARELAFRSEETRSDPGGLLMTSPFDEAESHDRSGGG
jgi:hypothetical protein